MKFLIEIYVNIKNNLVRENWIYLLLVNVSMYLGGSFVDGKA